MRTATRVLGLLCLCVLTRPAAADLREDVLAAMRRAAEYHDEQVAVEGGYVWRYSADLVKREGEGEVGPSTAWVQPPGTPSVGMAYLRCYEATGDAYYLTLARRAGNILIRGQMRSGGWAANIELDDDDRAGYAYRIPAPGESRRARNVSSFDDNQTQSATRLLMHLDRALGFRDLQVHEAAAYALDHIVAAQFPIGAWSQVINGAYELERPPVLRAAFPDNWPRVYTGHNNYWRFYTLNDNAMLDTIALLFEAGEVYGERRYHDAAVRGCGFLLLAQLPDPQPAWAQQYDYDMHPCWARKFEPPAVTGGESQGVMLTLIDAYRRTGERKYLEPIPRALAYLKQSRLPGGGIARFYEMKTNKPLYFTRDYTLTYDGSDVPTHYAFKVSDRLDQIEREYDAVKDADVQRLREQLAAERDRPVRLTDGLTQRARRAVDTLDARGAWLTPGPMRYAGAAEQVIDMRVYVDRLSDLADYAEATR